MWFSAVVYSAAHIYRGRSYSESIPGVQAKQGSFGWGGDGSVRGDWAKCLDTMAVAKERWRQELTETGRELYKKLYEKAP